MSAQVREPAVAGMFYPADPHQCGQQVDMLLADNPANISVGKPLALIVPHAGYVYSGAVAARAYNLLTPYAGEIKRVVLLGPSHRVPLLGMAVPSVKYFQTPLGDIPIDGDSCEEILQLPQVQKLDLAHQYEHSLEVHLPFLQKVLGEFQLLPVVVGECQPDAVAAVLKKFWGQGDTLIIVSTDLSHFLDYDSAQIADARTSKEIEQCHYYLNGQQACGCYAVNGLLLEASRTGVSVTRIELSNSGDSSGDKSRVVGYGAYAVH
jgi:hypothetical protein